MKTFHILCLTSRDRDMVIESLYGHLELPYFAMDLFFNEGNYPYDITLDFESDVDPQHLSKIVREVTHCLVG